MIDQLLENQLLSWRGRADDIESQEKVSGISKLSVTFSMIMLLTATVKKLKGFTESFLFGNGVTDIG